MSVTFTTAIPVSYNIVESGFSNELNTTSLIGGPSRIATLTAASIMTCFLTVGITGVLWLLIVLLSKQDIRRNTINIFIISLCFNDFINLSFNQPMIVLSYANHDWILGNFICCLVPELNMVLNAVSLWHHALISVHRYFVVVHNNCYTRMNKSLYISIVIIGTRLLPLVLSLTLLTYTYSKGFYIAVYSPRLLRCVYDTRHGGGLRVLVVVVGTLLLPCTVVALCFSLIFCHVHTIGRRTSISERTLLSREIQITKMFGIVFFMFMLGYLPYGFVRMADKGRTMNADVYVMVTVLYAAASCFNPVIFGVMNRDLRRVALEIVGFKRLADTRRRRTSELTCYPLRSFPNQGVSVNIDNNQELVVIEDDD